MRSGLNCTATRGVKTYRVSVGNRHLADAQSVEHTPALVVHIMNNSTLARVESHPEPPLLPLDQALVSNLEGRAIGLLHIQGLQILAGAIRQQFWHIFRCLAVVDDVRAVSLVGKAVLLATGGQTVNADDLLLVGVHHRDERQGVSIEIGVRVAAASIVCEDEALEVATGLILKVQTTVRPRLDDDLKALGQLELGNGILKLW